MSEEESARSILHNGREIAVGDWIRCAGAGSEICEVLYLRKHAHYPWQWKAYTTFGCVDVDSILEVRKPTEEER